MQLENMFNHSQKCSSFFFLLIPFRAYIYIAHNWSDKIYACSENGDKPETRC